MSDLDEEYDLPVNVRKNLIKPNLNNSKLIH